MKIHGVYLTFALMVGLAAAAPSPAQAQQTAAATPANTGELTEIVVTAEKRVESVQSSAVAVSVVSGDALANKGVTDVLRLNDAVPGLAVDDSLGQTVIFLRGIGPQINLPQYASSVPFQLDGADVQRESLSTGLFDVAQLEVLRGPQGTLYGRNAIGGVVNIVSNRPVNKYEGSVDLEGGNYGTFRSDGMINVPFTDVLYGRLAFQTVSHDGYETNGAGQQVAESARGELLYDPKGNFDFLLTFSGGHGGGNQADWIPKTCGYALPATIKNPAGCGDTPHKYGLINSDNPWYDPQSTAGDFEEENNWQIAAQMNYRFGTDLTLTFLPEYAVARQDQFALVGPTGIATHVRDSQGSEELRLANAAGKEQGSVNWLVGLYHFVSNVPFAAHIEPATSQPTYYPITAPSAAGDYFPPVPGAYVKVSEPQIEQQSYAAFGQVRYSLLDSLGATAGIRASSDEEKGLSEFGAFGAPFFPPLSYTDHDQKKSRVDWKVGLDFDVSKTSLLYANVQTGYLNGGFSLAGDFKPETLLAFSAGSKNRFVDNRLEFNAEAFYYDYSNYQLSFNNPTSGLQQIFNAPKAKVYGADFETQFSITPADKVDGTLELLRAYITDFITPYSTYGDPANSTIVIPGGTSLAGYDLIESPTVSASIGYEHDWALASGGQIAGRVDNHYESSHWGDYEHQEANYSPPFVKTNITLTYTSAQGGWHLGAYVYNLENAASFGQGGAYAGSYILPPRTYGAKFGMKF
jgi:iron complex outermembrane receptor protein